ncbi:TPA: virulence factor TspB C-terminal domain-related protein [Acinetobacter baumannii]
MIHRINVFLLSLFVALAPNFIFLQAANATTVTAEGWSVTKRLVQGATTFYDGAKSVALNGKTYLAAGTASITPTASQVSRMIVGTGAVLAVDLAIKTLIGAVDYVMDPANNRVVYNGTSVGTFYWDQYPNVTFSTAQQACQYASTHGSYSKWKFYSVVQNGNDNFWCKGKELKADGTEYFPENDPATYAVVVGVAGPADKRTLPYDTVASQIISDAIANKDDAKAYVSSVADTALDSDEQRQLVPASNVVNQLNNTQSIPTTETAQGQAVPQANPNDPTAPKAPPTDIKINFPVFCEWAPTVCQAAQAAINFPKTFLEKFQKWDDWINRETKPYTYDETKLDTEDKRTFDFSVFNENRFSVDDKCPAPEPHTFALAGQTVSFSFDLQPVCSILEMAKPALIAASYIYAAYIVIGASRG